MTSEQDLKLTLEGVGGWLHTDEAAELYASVMSITPDRDPVLVVEIGSWLGRSTIALGLAAKKRGKTKVVAVDPHLGQLRATAGEDEPTYGVFRRNIAAAGVDDVVEPMRTTSHEARPEILDNSVDLLFIDGLHDYENVRRDFNDWRSALAEGAIVAFNDASTPGVYRVLRESVIGKNRPFVPKALVRSTLFTRFSADPLTSVEKRRARRIDAILRLRRAANPLVRHMPTWMKSAGNVATRLVTSGSR